MTMYPSYFVLFFFGVPYFQLQTIVVISCPPPDDITVGAAKVIQFCSGSEVISHNIYIDSSDASARVTNCTCNFSTTNDTTVLLTTTSDKTSDCRTNIKYGVVNSALTNYSGSIKSTMVIQSEFNYTLMLTNGQIDLTTYCLHLLIVKRKQDYDHPGPKADPHRYMNHAVVPDEDDDDGDEMRDNELYRSIDDEPNEESHTSGYAEVNLTGIRLQNTAFDVGDYADIDEPTNPNNLKVNNSDHSKNDQNIYSTPSSRPVVDVQGRAVYSMPVKKQKNK
ncbi:hypothetical protein KUTeg_018187 [Tegillarca granosa]|uniref:Uncharacterized protein n=1 Tax=Tegillarca granosa TaxID=220873 RepID=A0ABQ9EIK3_TEGGR|nr:hypothetical protein KUTeg_018187 [Tegillarca granosa]